MKKVILAIIATFAFSVAAFAQNSGSAYSNGDNLLNVGIGLGTPFFGSGYSSSLPINPTVSFEHGVTDEISVGAQLSYASSKFDDFGYNFKESATYIGVRGSYHFNDILELDKKFDVYGGASLGYVIVSINDGGGYGSATASGAGFGLYGGGKYLFAPNIGVFAEVGYQSLSFLSVGVAFKF